ncbi:hypothetical protein Q0812_02055 [Brevundimonas sp. 2R-24]|uniref:Uncharacterized protein n=1 Tax=Peiella sedimenti TaxID=3061083 RepID=A0ABT8SJN9_9CAUL|nr:hypothetical protein [Caulobacteraceae bacterium XZ-24]
MLALIAAAALAQAPTADGLPTYDEVGLTWARMPSLRQMQRLYGRNVQGEFATSQPMPRVRVDLACEPDAAGALDCQALESDDADPRWSTAAEQLVERARVRTIDGGTPEGRRFGFRVSFGNWDGRDLPERFHPTEAGLRWTRNPKMAELWSMRGQRSGEDYSAELRCTTLRGGRLNCDVERLGGGATPEFAFAARQAMEEARVTRVDDQPLEGRQFNWTLTIMRQGHCNPVGLSGDDGLTTTGPSLDAQGNAVGSGELETYRGNPRCYPAMLQVYGPRQRQD